MPELSLLPTQALIEELKGRADALVVLRLEKRGEESGITVFDYAGGQAACLGLLELCRREILDEHAASGEPEAEE